MFKPKYLIMLSTANFSLYDSAACLGEQLVDILNFIKNLLPEHIWFGAHIWTNNNQFLNKNFETFKVKKIGDLNTLTCLASQTSQFINGVFLAIREEQIFPEYSVEIDTEDERFRIVESPGVLLEIRAFDTSYFEIYAEDQELIQKIALHYGLPIHPISKDEEQK